MRRILLTVACCALCAPAALAQDAPPDSTAPGVAASPSAVPETANRKQGHDITKAEFMARAQERAEKRFARIDTNGDGVITRDEMRAARAAMKDRHQGARPQGGEGGRNGNTFP